MTKRKIWFIPVRREISLDCPHEETINKNIKSSFKGSENIRKIEGAPDISHQQSSEHRQNLLLETVEANLQLFMVHISCVSGFVVVQINNLDVNQGPCSFDLNDQIIMLQISQHSV